MKKLINILIGIVVAMVLLFASGALYTVDETQQVVITQFGEPMGETITKAGLHFKAPFIQQANYFEERILQWDGNPNQIPTKDKRYIWVDTTARWKIVDALKFMQSVTNEAGAHARLDDVVDAATRDYITNHNLVEIVRNSNRIIESRGLKDQDEIKASDEALETILVGRDAITRKILGQAQEVVPQYGIELVDVRIKRINYVKEVRNKVYERMVSERKRAAERYRSEGQGKKREIEGQVQKELREIQSVAYRTAQEVKGKADAEAIEIYADAYNKDPEFYAFLKTLEAYKNTVDKETTIIFSPENEYLEYFNTAK
ncbi:MAG: protease modulator HflC [Candidatus Omnitrophica bacterium]|nr:protease modulator HflC [Candidatus Omnitrophota bacterium]MBU4457556.1 protease modulator HflC [Candidatus Omnitrophota bacterium]